MKKTPFACDMSAIEPSMRNKHIENIKKLFQSVKEINEIQNGYTFNFPDVSGFLFDLIAFIEKERLCCPFFGFVIEIKAGSEIVRLKITGRSGVKEFIKAEFEAFIPNNLNW